MNQETTIADFLQAYEAGDADALDDLLADDFIFEDPTAPTTLNKGTFIEWARALGAAFPVLDLEASDVEATVDGASAVVAVAGVQENPLDLSVFGLDVLPAVDARLDLPPQTLKVHLDGGLVVACTVQAHEGTGIGAIIDQVNNVVAIA